MAAHSHILPALLHHNLYLLRHHIGRDGRKGGKACLRRKGIILAYAWMVVAAQVSSLTTTRTSHPLAYLQVTQQ